MKKFCLIFRLQEFVGRMTKIENRYWLETDSFTKTPFTQDLPSTDGIRTTKHPYIKYTKHCKPCIITI